MKKKLGYAIAVIAVIVAGFALGRMTGLTTASLPTLADVHRDFPLFPAPPKSEPVLPSVPKPEKDVIVESPLDGERPDGPSFVVSGRANADGAPLLISVAGDDGTVLATRTVDVEAAAGDTFGRFSVTVVLPNTPEKPVTLTVARQGAEDSADVRKLAYGGGGTDVDVKAYFVNEGFGGEGNCDTVFPLQRTVQGGVAIYRAAVQELLDGPGTADGAAGYGSAIPAGTKLKSIAADANGVVTADFDTHLTAGGTKDRDCRFQTIRAQIGATLRQFPEVHDVIITVNGKAGSLDTAAEAAAAKADQESDN